MNELDKLFEKISLPQTSYNSDGRKDYGYANSFGIDLNMWFDSPEKRDEYYRNVIKELRQLQKLQAIFDQDLIDWKSSSEMEAECGYAAITGKFTKNIYSILKHMKDESEK